MIRGMVVDEPKKFVTDAITIDQFYEMAQAANLRNGLPENHGLFPRKIPRKKPTQSQLHLYHVGPMGSQIQDSWLGLACGLKYGYRVGVVVQHKSLRRQLKQVVGESSQRQDYA